ncbi:glycosyl hydrolase 2 galactose-binding domain-containing protein [Tunturiibacter lichenicola]|uniref:glycosyl hydrolase 2 galactose-binding domain-containing protein n=1 Tax=Tunturiibacter lichenicola TaxID=2051959 RepID=UPI0021B1A9CB|nr:sugar-binding domain-containing protein [Edaphobacter lichenicola]
MVFLSFAWGAPGLAATDSASTSTPLKSGWAVQSDCKIHGDGAKLSVPEVNTEGWYTATIPATVLAVQVAAGEFKDMFVGTNLRSVPGTSYPQGDNFSNLEMPADSPYRCGWWYRKTFHVAATERGKTFWMRFGGINYRADIWLNGQKIADSTQVQGAYRTYEFDVTKALKPGQENVLAVETFAPTPTDLGINWVDWNPCPPDKDMGLWGAVTLVTSGPVAVRSPMATSHFLDASLKTVELTVRAEVTNSTDHTTKGRLEGNVAGVAISQPVTLDAGETKTVTFAPGDFSQLRIKNPHVWWPADVGAHPLETLTLRFVLDGAVSDETSIRFGIREVTSELTPKGYRLFHVNQHPILIRGAGWTQDMLLRQQPERLAEEFRLVHDMHLNTIRLEGKMETNDFFRLADEQGVMVMAGWCCCDHWEHWDKWTPDTLNVATASLKSQLLRIRSHPSLIAWLNGSDNPPPANVETAYLKVLAQTDWPNVILSSATATPTTVSGPSGVKMTGPYDFVAPSYWLVDSHYGGAYGFNTETSPGPAVPSLQSLKKMLPADHQWPQDAVWGYHAGGEGFQNIHVFNDAMKATYGEAKTAERYNQIAQSMAFDGERAMFEAYGRNKYTSTGVIQWMLNNAWPSSIWHLYDYYLDAGGGYYGTKKACELLHVQYSYDDHSVYVVNSLYSGASGLTAVVHVYDLDLKELFTQSNSVDAGPDSSVKAIDIPQEVFQTASSTYFIRLELKDAKGTTVSRNFYWVPSKLTEFDWAKTNYTHTPAKTSEDMTALGSLPIAHITATAHTSGDLIRVHLTNPSTKLAFQVAAELKDEQGERLPRITWSDNYIELMPGEERELTASIPSDIIASAGSKRVEEWKVKIEGWNTAAVTVSTNPSQ